MILPILLIGFAFYFIILRPQKRDQQKVQDMRNAVKKGDRVKSIGGIYGTVTAVDTSRNIVTVQVDKNVKLDFDRDAIATVVTKEDAVAEKSEPAAAAPAK
jgi:preprotein translocase subunit YajC